MPSVRSVRPLRLLVLLALAVLATAATPAASARTHHAPERLVLRGDSTAVPQPCDAGLCIALTDGTFRATPLGSGAYTGSLQLAVAQAFPNGEGGICAPLRGRIVLGAGSAHRLVLALGGESCQDGGGDPAAASFTGLARVTVLYGTGRYAGSRGLATASLTEDAAHHHRLTLIGRIAR